MKVIITLTAKDDLIEIGRFIGENNPHRAVTFVDELLSCCFSLTNMPKAYPLLPRYKTTEIRRCVYHNYSIFYVVSENNIEILRILYGARNYEQLLFSDME